MCNLNQINKHGIKICIYYTQIVIKNKTTYAVWLKCDIVLIKLSGFSITLIFFWENFLYGSRWFFNYKWANLIKHCENAQKCQAESISNKLSIFFADFPYS